MAALPFALCFVPVLPVSGFAADKPHRPLKIGIQDKSTIP
jgi:hypothetical protein